MRFTGTVFRAHNPRWSFAPTSGDGAARYGGRFNPVGMAALYTSLRPETAWREAQQGLPFKAQPLTICGYVADCADMADLTDPTQRRFWDIAPEDLSCAWEAILERGATPPGWAMAKQLHAAGIAGIIVPSFAPGALAQDRNAVFWRWQDRPPHQVAVIDDEQRLPRNQRSWE